MAVGTVKRHVTSRMKQFKKGADERGWVFELDFEDVYNILTRSCTYCGEFDLMKSSIDRTDNTKGYLKDNVKSCCRVCNMAKGRRTESEFINMCMRVSTHMIKNSVCDIDTVLREIEVCKKKEPTKENPVRSIGHDIVALLRDSYGKKLKSSQIMRSLAIDANTLLDQLNSMQSDGVVSIDISQGIGRPAKIVKLLV